MKKTSRPDPTVVPRLTLRRSTTRVLTLDELHEVGGATGHCHDTKSDPCRPIQR